MGFKDAPPLLLGSLSAFTCTQENQISALVQFHKMQVDTTAGFKLALRTLNGVGLTPPDSWRMNVSAPASLSAWRGLEGLGLIREIQHT